MIVVAAWIGGSLALLAGLAAFHAYGRRRDAARDRTRPSAPEPVATPADDPASAAASYNVAQPGLPDRRRSGERDVSTRPLHRMVH